MKISTDRKRFIDALNRTALFVSPKNYAFVNQFVSLDTIKDEALVLSAIGENGTARFVLDDEKTVIYETGKCLVPPALIRDIASCQNEINFWLECENENISLYGGRYEKIPYMNPDNFCGVPEEDMTSAIQIDAEKLRKAIALTSTTCDKGVSTKYTIAGILFELESDTAVNVVGTDGKRITHVKIYGAKKPSDAEQKYHSCVVPIREAANISRAFNGYVGKISLKITENYATFAWGSGEYKNQIKVRTLEGRYPKWQRIFPEQLTGGEYSFMQHELLGLIQRAAVCADESNPGIVFNFSQDKITVFGGSSKKGGASITMERKTNNNSMKMKIDPCLIRDFLSQLSQEDRLNCNLSERFALVTFSESDFDTRFLLSTMS